MNAGRAVMATNLRKFLPLTPLVCVFVTTGGGALCRAEAGHNPFVMFGSSSVSPMGDRLAGAFASMTGSRSVNCTSCDSDYVIHLLANNKCDVGLVIESLAAKSPNKLPEEFETFPLAQYAVAVVVNSRSPVRSMSVEQLGTAFSTAATWASVTDSEERQRIELYAPLLQRTESYIFGRNVLPPGRWFADALRDRKADPPRQKRFPDEIMGEVIRNAAAIGFVQLGPELIPSSVYGEYARLGVAMHVLSAHLRPDAERPKDVALHVETLLRDSKNPSIIEHALWLKVFLSGREERNRIPYEIQQVNPKSEYLQRLRKMGIMPKEPGREDEAEQPRPSPEEKPTTRGPIPLVIDQDSLAGLPAGAANLLEKYWKAFARRDIDGAMECLSDDFVSIDGTRDRRRRYWESTLATVDVTHLHIRVDKASEATSYRSPPGPVGKSARLQGDLLVVQGQGTALEKGRTEASAITWVLRRVNEDTWTIVSEFAGPVGQQQGEAGESPEAIDPADQPRPPAQEPPEKPDGAETAHKGWIVVHPARTKFDPTHFKTVPVEDRSFLHEKHRRDEILRELIEKYGADKDVEIREGGGQIFVVYRWVKDPWLEQMREEYARATLDQFKLIYARDDKVGPYLLKDVKTQYDVTVDHVPYALMLQFHDDQRLATAEVTIGGQKDLVDPTTVAPPDPDEWRPTRMGDSLVYWRRTADGTQLSWYNKWGHKLMVSSITHVDDPLLKHFLERFSPPARREPPQ